MFRRCEASSAVRGSVSRCRPCVLARTGTEVYFRGAVLPVLSSSVSGMHGREGWMPVSPPQSKQEISNQLTDRSGWRVLRLQTPSKCGVRCTIPKTRATSSRSSPPPPSPRMWAGPRRRSPRVRPTVRMQRDRAGLCRPSPARAATPAPPPPAPCSGCDARAWVRREVWRPGGGGDPCRRAGGRGGRGSAGPRQLLASPAPRPPVRRGGRRNGRQRRRCDPVRYHGIGVGAPASLYIFEWPPPPPCVVQHSSNPPRTAGSPAHHSPRP